MRVVPLGAFAKQAEALAALAGAFADLEEELIRTGLLRPPPPPHSGCHCAGEDVVAAKPTASIVRTQALRLAQSEEGIAVPSVAVVDTAILRALRARRARGVDDGGYSDDTFDDRLAFRALVQQCESEFRDDVERDRAKLVADVAAVEGRAEVQGQALASASASLYDMLADFRRAGDVAAQQQAEIRSLQSSQASLSVAIERAREEAAAHGATAWQIAKADTQALREELVALAATAAAERKELRQLASVCEASVTVASQRFASLEAELRVLPVRERHGPEAARLIRQRGAKVIQDVRKAAVEDPDALSLMQFVRETSPNGFRRGASRHESVCSDDDGEQARELGAASPSAMGGHDPQELLSIRQRLEQVAGDVSSVVGQANAFGSEVRNCLGKLQTEMGAAKVLLEDIPARQQLVSGDVAGLTSRMSALEDKADAQQQLQQRQEQEQERQRAGADAVHAATSELREALEEHSRARELDGARVTDELGELRAYVEELKTASAGLAQELERQALATAEGTRLSMQVGQQQEELAVEVRAEIKEAVGKLAAELRMSDTRLLEAQGGLALQLDRLREDLIGARRTAAEELADATRRATDEVGAVIAATESKLRLELRETRGWAEGAIDAVRDDHARMLTAAREASEESVTRAQQAAARGLAEAAYEAKVRADHAEHRLMTEASRIDGEAAALLRRLEQEAAALRLAIGDAEAAGQHAVTQLKSEEIRARAEESARLSLAIGTVGQGLMAVTEICGLLPRQAAGQAAAACGGAHTLVNTLLDWEMGGQSLARRIEEAWDRTLPGNPSLLEASRTGAELAARRQHLLLGGAHLPPGTDASSVGAGAASPPVPRPPTSPPTARSPTQLPAAIGATPRGSLGGTPRGGRLPLTSTETPSMDWTRTTSALAPLTIPKVGYTLAELRAHPEFRSLSWARSDPLGRDGH